MRGLRVLLVVDAAVLVWLGMAFILLPHQVALRFGFNDLPAGVNYMIGLWGCVLATMAIGYIAAAVNPMRHVVWVQVGIARGTLECLLGIGYAMSGTISWRQGAFGIVVAGGMTAAYAVLYPRVGPRSEAAPDAVSEAPQGSITS